MESKKNKISNGLSKMLNSKGDHHFYRNNDVFVGNPEVRNNYHDLFYTAQLAEIACTGGSRN